MPKFWITKYALSSGIAVINAGEPEDGVLIDNEGCFASFFHGEGKDWHRTEEGAFARAEAMRVAKIASLKKQIAKLEKLSFREGGDANV